MVGPAGSSPVLCKLFFRNSLYGFVQKTVWVININMIKGSCTLQQLTPFHGHFTAHEEFHEVFQVLSGLWYIKGILQTILNTSGPVVCKALVLLRRKLTNLYFSAVNCNTGTIYFSWLMTFHSVDNVLCSLLKNYSFQCCNSLYSSIKIYE